MDDKLRCEIETKYKSILKKTPTVVTENLTELDETNGDLTVNIHIKHTLGFPTHAANNSRLASLAQTSQFSPIKRPYHTYLNLCHLSQDGCRAPCRLWTPKTNIRAAKARPHHPQPFFRVIRVQIQQTRGAMINVAPLLVLLSVSKL